MFIEFSSQDAALFGYVIVGAIALLLAFVIARWVFAINKRVEQNDTIIYLLRKIAEKEIKP